MDIERLKELRKALNAENWNAKTKIEVIALTDDLIARHDNFVKHLRAAITALQAYQPWVSVDDRLPTEDDADGKGNVMAYFADGDIRTWEWDEIGKWNDDSVREYEGLEGITHWRSMLPEPPKGELL